MTLYRSVSVKKACRPCSLTQHETQPHSKKNKKACVEQARGHSVRLHGAHVGGCGRCSAQTILLMRMTHDLVVLLPLDTLRLPATPGGKDAVRMDFN